MGDGGITSLDEKINSIADTRLVVIDTLARFRPDSGNKSRNLYEADYNDIGRIKDLADNHDIAILIIHHLRKMGAQDIMDTFSGTLGLTGAADTLMVLDKKGVHSVLNLSGRDIESEQYILEFNNLKLSWSLLGKARDVQSSIAKQSVYDSLKTTGVELTVKEVVDLTGMQNGYVKKALSALTTEGKISRVKRGIYKI